MKKIIDCLLNKNLAEIPRKGRKEMKSIQIGNQKYRYNKDKPISQKKLNSVKNTNEYRSYANNKLSLNLGMKKTLTKYAIKNKFRVEQGKSAFRRYANNLTLVNKHFEGEMGLSMIVHQKSLLQEFLRNNRNMKLNIRTTAVFTKPSVAEDDDFDDDVGEQELLYNLPSTRFNIHNEDDLNQAIEDSVKQILLQIEKLEGTMSNLKFKKMYQSQFIMINVTQLGLEDTLNYQGLLS